MSGSSLDGLDIVFTELEETRGTWSYEVRHAACSPYTEEWKQKLSSAKDLSALEYMRLHAAYGHLTAELVQDFIEQYQLQHQVQLIASHGHTVFHEPANLLTSQLGDGAVIAAKTCINVVSDLRNMDMALGGQGAPIVPMGEKLLFPDYDLLLNIGGIANISARLKDGYTAFDICPANRVLNLLANQAGKDYDENGEMASKGFIRDEPLALLNQQEYYRKPFPKSLANELGTDILLPILQKANLSVSDALRTMVEHIVIQTTRSVGKLLPKLGEGGSKKMLVTGGGAFNQFLVERLQAALKPMGVELEIPDSETVQYKEAIVMAWLGILRWREENTVIHTATGANRSSIGGAVWMGQEA